MSSSRETPSNTVANSAKDAADSPPDLGFGEALAEIEAILRRIEDDKVDIDELASSLSEAAGLLDLCRTKIRRAEEDVEKVSKRMNAEDP